MDTALLYLWAALRCSCAHAVGSKAAEYDHVDVDRVPSWTVLHLGAWALRMQNSAAAYTRKTGR